MLPVTQIDGFLSSTSGLAARYVAVPSTNQLTSRQCRPLAEVEPAVHHPNTLSPLSEVPRKRVAIRPERCQPDRRAANRHSWKRPAWLGSPFEPAPFRLVPIRSPNRRMARQGGQGRGMWTRAHRARHDARLKCAGCGAQTRAAPAWSMPRRNGQIVSQAALLADGGVNTPFRLGMQVSVTPDTPL